LENKEQKHEDTKRKKESAQASICLPKEGKAKCLLGKDKQETSSSSAKTIKIKLKVKGNKPNVLYPTESDHHQYVLSFSI